MREKLRLLTIGTIPWHVGICGILIIRAARLRVCGSNCERNTERDGATCEVARARSAMAHCILCRGRTTKNNRCKIGNHEAVGQTIIEKLVQHSAALIQIEATVREGFLCRPCLRSVEKLIKLRVDVKRGEEEFQRKIELAAVDFGLTCTSTATSTTPRAAKRTPPQQPSPAAKRRRYNTPVRRQLQSMIPTGLSPDISVSSYYTTC